MRAEIRSTRVLFASLALFVLLATLVGPALAAKPWEKFKFPELGEVNIPDYERHVLENGLTVYLLRDTTWPLVEGEILVRTGGAFEPAEKVGLAEVTGEVLRSGGTETIPADDLDEMLERMGAYIESNIGDTSGSVNFSFLSKDAAKGLDLVAGILRTPAFDEEKIEVAVTGLRAVVARRNDNLNGIVGREIQRAVWGNEHPYARNIEYATIDNIRREDILEFYEYFYHPNNMMLAVWGDFEPTEMLSMIRDRLGDWPRVENEIPELPNEPMQTQRRRVLVGNKDDVNQARFAVGHVGIRADDPDYYAMSVANRILGGGFGDRLFNEVRTNLGLAYNVGSSSGASFSRPGTFQAYCGTKSESIEEALTAVLGEVDKIREAEVTEQELNDAKEAILNSNVFNYVRPEQVLTRKMNLDYLGYPADFLETYNERVRSVDQAAVLDVMHRRVDPTQFAVVAVGKTEDWGTDLGSFGPVEELDISIPEPSGPEFPEPTDETIEKGRAVLAAALKAHGGNAVSNLKSVYREESVALSMGGMDLSASLKASIIFPDRMQVVMNLPFGEVVQTVGTDAVWAKTPQGIQDVGGDQAAEMRRQIIEDPLYLLGNFDGFQVQLLDPEQVGDAQADVVLVWVDEESWLKLFFDSGSHALVKAESKGKHPMTQAPGMQETYFDAVQDFSGIQVPTKYRLLHDGEQIMAFELQKFEANASIEESIFSKPSS